jgi:phage terminase large subunit-like protein
MIAIATHEHEINQYVYGVLNDQIPAGQPLKWACQRYVDDRKHGHERGLRFDGVAATNAIDFFPMLKHSTGEYAGLPFDLYPWQMFGIWNLFGWKWKETGYRRFTQCYWSVARGNGKSPIAAGITTYVIGYDPDPDREDGRPEARGLAFTSATMAKQARIVFDEIRRFIDQEKWLRTRFNRCFRDSIVCESDYSTIEPMPSEGYSADGRIPTMIVRDELHEWKEHHRDTMEKQDTSMGKRRQPMLLEITTAGSDTSDIWIEEYNLAKAVVDINNNIKMDELFVLIHEIDDDDDPLDDSVWEKANPMLKYGIVKVNHLRKEAGKAHTSGTELQKFKRYYCNRQSTSVQKPITSEAWALGDVPLPDLTDLDCHVGFDWGWRDDLTAMCYVFPLETDDDEARRKYIVKADVWIPSNGARDLTREPWCSWIRDGWLRETKGERSTNPKEIYDVFDECYNDYNVVSVSVDPSNCRDFGRTVEVEYGIPLNNFYQTKPRYNEPLREFILAVNEGRIIHGGNPLLEWCASNMAIEEDTAGIYIMPSKLRSFDKIDPIVAIIMAIGAVIKMPSETNRDYDEVTA